MNTQKCLEFLNIWPKSIIYAEDNISKTFHGIATRDIFNYSMPLVKTNQSKDHQIGLHQFQKGAFLIDKLDPKVSPSSLV